MACAICTMRFYVLDYDSQNDYPLFTWRAAAVVVWRGSHWPVDGRGGTVRPMNINWKCKQQRRSKFCVNLHLIVWNAECMPATEYLTRVLFSLFLLFLDFTYHHKQPSDERNKTAYFQESWVEWECVSVCAIGSASSGCSLVFVVWNMNTIGVGNETKKCRKVFYFNYHFMSIMYED